VPVELKNLLQGLDHLSCRRSYVFVFHPIQGVLVPFGINLNDFSIKELEGITKGYDIYATALDASF
jgi:hypothetical protein